jgi:hypothetical protein
MSQSESSRTHYLKNRDQRIADKKARKKRNHGFIQEFKRTHACVRCGESEPCCLDFHHLDPSAKFDTVSRMGLAGFGLEKIKVEIAKCEMLCANCHRRVHRGL